VITSAHNSSLNLDVYLTPQSAIMASIEGAGKIVALPWSHDNWTHLFENAGFIRQFTDGTYYASRSKEPSWCVKLLPRVAKNTNS
jgi:hypothetical protein